MNQTHVIVIGKGRNILFYSTEGSMPFFTEKVDQADYFTTQQSIDQAMAFARQLKQAKNNNLRTTILVTDL